MTDIKDIQKAELDILQTTLDILNRHGIRAFLICGSCLGAVRHNGFIPWDDDVDIGLLRPDYEKARELLLEELPEGYRYCDRHTEKEYPYNFGKVRKENTAFVHAGDAHLNIYQGVYMDIFPFDVTPDDEEAFLKQYKAVRRLRRRIDLKCMSYKKYGKLRPFWQLPLILAGHILVNKQAAQDKLDKIIQEFNPPREGASGAYICSYLSGYQERARTESKWFGAGREVDFDGVKCLIPESYDPYLTHLFGDYMKLPPEEKRVSHHDVIFCSLTEPYRAGAK